MNIYIGQAQSGWSTEVSCGEVAVTPGLLRCAGLHGNDDEDDGDECMFF